MELLGDLGHVESLFFPFGDSVSVGAWFALDLPQAQKSYWTHLMVPLGDEAQVQPRFGLSDIVLILTQDRCTVCIECTTGSEIVLDAPDGLLGDVGHVESHFSPVWRLCQCRRKIGVQFCAKRAIGLEIILDAPDGNPR